MDVRKFNITVKEARNLAVRDRTSPPDPLVVLYIPYNDASIRHRSKSVRKTLDPVWDITFEVEIPQNEPFFVAEVCAETTFGSEKPIGAVKVHVDDVTVVPRDEWYKLTSTTQQQGKNTQGLLFMPTLVEAESHGEPVVFGEIHVIIDPVTPFPPLFSLDSSANAQSFRRNSTNSAKNSDSDKKSKPLKTRSRRSTFWTKSDQQTEDHTEQHPNADSNGKTTPTLKITVEDTSNSRPQKPADDAKENKTAEEGSNSNGNGDAEKKMKQQEEKDKAEKNANECERESEKPQEDKPKEEPKAKPPQHVPMPHIPDNRLISTFFVVGAADTLVTEAEKHFSKPRENGTIESCLEVTYQGKLVNAYPWLGKDDPPSSVWMFCVPGGLRIRLAPSEPTIYPFVLTASDGVRNYVTCLTTWCQLPPSLSRRIIEIINNRPPPVSSGVPGVSADTADSNQKLAPDTPLYFRRCYCLRSSLPCFSFCRAWLCTFYEACVVPSKRRVGERIIAQLLKQVPLPTASRPVQLRLTTKGNGEETLGPVLNTTAGRLERLDEPMRLVFASLRPSTLIKLFTALIMEEKLIVVSASTTVLTMTVQALASLIHPLTWAHVFIPVLPDALLPYLHSPTPYIIGLSRDCAASATPDHFEYALRFDVDDNTLVVPPAVVLPQLPNSALKTLEQDLSSILKTSFSCADNLDWDASAFDENNELSEAEEHVRDDKFAVGLRTAFLRFFLTILDDFRTYMVYVRAVPEQYITFDKSRFMDERAGGAEAFYRGFLSTQCFTSFLESHTRPKFSTFECLLVYGGKDLSFPEIAADVARDIATSPKEAPYDVAWEVPDDVPECEQGEDATRDQEDPAMVFRTEIIDTEEFEKQEKFVSGDDAEDKGAEEAFYRAAEARENHAEEAGMKHGSVTQRKDVDTFVKWLLSGSIVVARELVSRVNTLVQQIDGRKLLASEFEREYARVKFNGRLPEAAFVALSDVCVTAMKEAWAQKDFQTPSMFLGLADHCYHIANGADETVMDRLRSLDVWQKGAFWEDYFFARVDAGLRKMHVPSILHATLHYHELDSEAQHKLVSGEQEIVFKVLADFVLDMTKLAVPAGTVRHFAMKMGNTAGLDTERRGMLAVLVKNMQKMELPDMTELESLDDLANSARRDSMDGFFSDVVSPSRVGGPGRNDDSNAWHQNFTKMLENVAGDAGLSAGEIDKQMTLQLRNQQQLNALRTSSGDEMSSDIDTDVDEDDDDSGHRGGNSRAQEAVLHGHTAPVLCVRAIKHGIAASSGCDNTVRVWDTSNRTCIGTLQHHTGWVNCLEYAPTTQFLFSGSYDKQISVWDVQRLQKLNTMYNHDSSVTCLALHPRGCVSGSVDRRLILWDTRMKKPAQQLVGHELPPLCVGICGDNTVISGGRDKKVFIWDLRTGTTTQRMRGHDSRVRSIVMLGEGSSFVPVTTGEDGKLISWNIQTGKAANIIQAHDGSISKLSLSRPLNSLVTAGSDGVAKLWDPDTLRLRVSLAGHSDEVTVAVPFGRFIATGGADNKVKVWNPLVNMDVSLRCTGSLDSPASSPSPSEDLWDSQPIERRSGLELPLCRQTLTGHTLHVSDMCEIGDSTLATCGWDSTVRVWDFAKDFN